MAALVSLWTSVHPYLKVVIAAITGATLIVLAPIVFADVVAFATGGAAKWPDSTVLWRTWGAAALVVGTAYWAHGPQGKEVWTDEQKQALKDLKDGKL